MPNRKTQMFFVSYASGIYKKNIYWNNLFIKTFFRPDQTKYYTDEDLKNTSEYELYSDVFNDKVGGGYWAWKPYYILKTMKSAKEGDLVYYQDCGKGLRFKSFLKPKAIIKYTLQHGSMPGVIIPEYGSNKDWTNKACFELMQCDEEPYKTCYQVEATQSCWVVNEKNINFVEEWFKWCCTRPVVSNDDTERSKMYGYAINGHRHDQSILTNLIIKHNLKPVFQDENSKHMFKSISYLELHLRDNSLAKKLKKTLLFFINCRRKFI